MDENATQGLHTNPGLSLSNILAALPEDFPWRSHINCYDRIDSTNTAAKKAAAQGADAGTILIADSQTAGRGRLGRSFLSPPGMGIYLSVILRPKCPPGDLMHLTCAVAVAVSRAVAQCCGLQPGIKWTNDLVVSKRKLAGILTELSVNSDTGLVDFAVVGVGMNCCQRADDFPPELTEIATSIAMESGKAIDRSRLCAAMIMALYEMQQALICQKQAILQAYRANCITLGQKVCIIGAGSVRYAAALDIDDDGGLLVRYDNGETGTVTSGEVSVRGMYGYI